MRHARFVPLAIALIAAPTLGFAQAKADAAKDYPQRPIRLLVPNAPGSSVDTLSRIVASYLSQVAGQQVVVDNRAGAGGIIGMEIAKTAAPDGYTMIAATTAASTIAIHLMKKAPFDPVNDYDYVVQFAETPNVLVVNPGLPIKSVKDLIEFTKAKQGQVNMASAGSGAQSHLTGAYFMMEAHIQSVHIPYKGGGASVAAVMAGESQWTITPAPAVMSQVNAGRLRAIGHSLPKASPLLPNIPPIADSIPGFDYSGWQGFFLPKGTPKAINDKLRAMTEKTMALPEVQKQMQVQATEIVIRGPEEFRKVVADSVVKNGKVVKAVGLKVE
jgi:tripartite-type tricarboxylate transporter receptor subunit TctC